MTDLSWINEMSDTQRQAMLDSITRNRARDAVGTGGSAQQNDAFSQLESYLYDFGLQKRSDKTPNRLSVRLWNYIVDNGLSNEDQLWLWIQSQEEFKTRFPAFESLQKQKRAVTPAEYIQLEKQYAQVMRSSGIPARFFDQPDDFTQLIANNVSPNEFQQRIVSGFQRVAKSDPLIRQAFNQYFGVEGDSALAAFFIDPQRSAPMLQRAVQTAEINAAAQLRGVDINLNYATRLANMGVSYQDALQGMQRLKSMESLFAAGVSETNVTPQGSPYSDVFPGMAAQAEDDTMTDEERIGIETVFGTDSETSKQIELRLRQRRATAQGERSQNVTTRTGQTSIGSGNV